MAVLVIKYTEFNSNGCIQSSRSK